MDGKLYRYHPVTGKHAEDMSGEDDEAKQEMAGVLRDGLQLYWHLSDDGTYSRVDKANIAFVLHVVGVKLECFEAPPCI